MPLTVDRRQFVRQSLVTGSLAGLGGFGLLDQLPAVSAADAQLTPDRVQLSPDIEPLVRLTEQTPQDKLMEVLAERIRGGTTYQQLLTALMLAGVRGIKPRPVGFKFHAVLVVHSAHLASLASPDRERWLPLLWAFDNYKTSQARNKAEGGWVMAPADDGKLPSSAQARRRFIEAMDQWDEDGADRAVAALARSAGAGEIIELFWRYGARDFRDIGHKAIFVANGWRTLQTIGWRHAEPVLRSLAFALLEHEGTNPAGRDAEQDRPWRENLKRVGQIRPGWQRGLPTPSVAKDLVVALRTAGPMDVGTQMIEALNKGVDPSSLWDGLFLAAGELLMRQPGIVGIHCVTSINALHQGYLLSGNDETRRMLMLQGGAFLAMFRAAMLARGKLADNVWIDRLEKADTQAKGGEAIEEVFNDVSKDRLLAARKTLALVEGGQVDVEALLTAARRLIFLKGRDSHDYKFSSAALEDYYHVAPGLRAQALASSMFQLRGAGERDSDLIRRVNAALARG